MAGVGEASAIVGLIATAAQLSKAILGIAFKYNDAKKQIKWLGDEIAIFGGVLNQMRHLFGRDRLDYPIGFWSLMATIVDQCRGMLSGLEVYKDSLYSRQGSAENLSFRLRMKFVFTAKPNFIRARLESQKGDIQLMVELQNTHNLKK